MSKSKFKRFIYLLSPGGTYVAFWISCIIQQIIVASSTYFIARMGESLTQNPEGIFYYFWLFCISLTIGYIPGIAALQLSQKMLYKSFEKYLSIFYNKYLGKIFYRDHDEFKKKNYPILCSEAYHALDNFYQFHYDLITTSLNILFNITMIASMINYNILYAYALGGLIGFIILRILQPVIKKSSSEYLQNKITVQDILQSSWDTIFIDNPLNTLQWKKDLDSNLSIRANSNLKMNLYRNGSSSLSMLGVFTPILLVLFMNLQELQNNPSTLAIFIATLPRQVQLVQYMQSVFSCQAMFSQIKAHLEGILEPINHTPETVSNFEKYIKLNSIKLNRKQVKHQNIDEITNEILNSSEKRITIEGPNGSGKSTLLKILKERLGIQAYYLPSHHHLYFHTVLKGSTGEKLYSSIQKIISQADEKYLLLDEWDANLSINTSKEIDLLIDKATLNNKTVIEVRHIKSSSAQ